MSKKRRFLKWSLITLFSLVVFLLSFGIWFKGLIPPKEVNIETTQVKNLAYLSKNVQAIRGKILTVVTSTNQIGVSGKSTGYELTELARAYYVFQANGFEVEIASPLGGKAPVVIDDEDMGAFDYAFLNDSIAQHKAKHTIPLNEVTSKNYEAVFFVGGKGAMFDFPKNETIQTIIRNYYQSNKVIGAVCHGPAAFVNVLLDNGHHLLTDKAVSSFTNEEELLLIPEAPSIFPFLLQDKLMEQGANFNAGLMYLEKMSHDKNLITGQNPWSVWAVAETMITQMGYRPKHRAITGEENAVSLLKTYHHQGFQNAKELMKKMVQVEKKPINRLLIAKHSIIEVMKGNISRFFGILRLVALAKKMET